MTAFRCVTLSPLCLAAGLVPASLRAGAIALIDAADQPSDSVQPVLDGLRHTPGEIGVRLTPDQAGSAEPLVGREHVLVLCGWDPAGLARCLSEWARPGRAIWLEVLAGEDLAGEDLAGVDAELDFAGWLGRGSECGGRCGRESAFILAQHLARQTRPFWVQGGIGSHAAAACRAAGAAGIVLDDALLRLRDSPLPAKWRTILSALGPDDTMVLGAEWGEARRVAMRGDLAGARLRQRADDIAALAEEERAPAWRSAIREFVGWGDPDIRAWPLGQGGGALHPTVGRLIRAVGTAAERQVALAAAMSPLAEGSPLAQAHGTPYPVVQGPMTRVSDNAAFAVAVAAAGALPLVALAMLPGASVGALLDQTRAALGARPWGVGLLGYLDAELAEAQLAEVERVRPGFALIAGGRPDQAARLEACGIQTYIHVPVPSLLPLFLDQGARRFVFEGAECGGHVGPLNSFALWDAMIGALLAKPVEDVHVLFAGGIHDARSAAMVAAMAAPLAERGYRIGILMGSAYLFTAEAVATGAIVESFQSEALACRRTTLIETRPGHRIRCAPTPFLDDFAARDRQLRRDGHPADERGKALETLLAGRLRLASKGVERTDGALRPVDAQRQHAEGVFMLGELAALRHQKLTCAELHDAVSGGATRLLAALAGDQAMPPPDSPPPGPPVAIIGIGCLLPGAHDPQTLWRNLLERNAAIREIPAERWDWRLFYDQDPAARDRIASKWGGFLDPLGFDPLRFGIPPRSLASICLPQLLALETSRRALEDAGLGDLSNDPLLRERTAVIFGVASAGDLEHMVKARTALPLVAQAGEDALSRLPEWTEESYPGILLNIVAGRVANRFDLGGPNFIVDAACASSLAALDQAVRELQTGRSDMALAGAVEGELTPHAYMAFSKTQALSPQGRARVFDEGADGIVIAEGAVVLVLKRLTDAERDGDRVYAVIRGIGGSSDGKGLGLTAPKPAGQVRAVERAHRAAGTRVGDLGLYEAHGTGTKVGDRAELETIVTALGRDGAAAGACAVGSVKSLLGHTRAAAGLVGVLKAALALHHRVLPPHAGVETPLAPLREPGSPIRLLDRPLPWLAEQPRRAGVSAFGFGGTNYHVVLEEHGEAGAAGGAIWPCEMVVAAAADRVGLLDALGRLESVAAQIGRGVSLADVALSSALAVSSGPARVALLANSGDDLVRQIGLARRHLDEGRDPPPGLFWSLEPLAGGLTFLFPGQGSQHPGMAAELALYHPELRRALEGCAARDLILTPAAFDDEGRAAQDRALADTRMAQPAIAAVSCGMLDLARRLGLAPERAAGHSFGEFVALHAAGVLDRRDLLALAAERGRVMADIGPESGTMAMASLGPDALSPYLAGIDGVGLANLNSPAQVVLSGRTEAVEAVLARLATDGHTTRRLTVSAAFHSPLMRPARQPFADFLATAITIAAPAIPVHANLDGGPYPSRPDDIRRRWVGHLEQPVDFVAQVEAMWAAGARCFLELGPGRVLTGLVRQILDGRPYLAVAADGGMRGWLAAMAQLWVSGQAVDLTALYQGRPAQSADPAGRSEPMPAPDWLMDGGRIHRAGQPALMAERPFRDADSPADIVGGGPDAPLAAAYGEYQETMRRFLEQQERVLMHLVDGRGAEPVPTVPRETPPALVSPAAPALQLSPPPAAAMPDGGQLLDRLTALVSDRTGFPPDVLRPDQDLEAELGVDSIKRVEIITKLVRGLPPSIARHLQQRLDRLVRVKSLSGLVAAVLRESPDDGSVEIVTAQASIGPGGTCPRFVMVPAVKPLLRLGEGELDGLYLVSADDGPVAEAVAAGLRRHGAGVGMIFPALLGDVGALGERVAVLREVHGPVRGVVHLGALSLPERCADLESWRAATLVAIKGLFALLQVTADEIEDEASPLRLVACTRMGGDWGRGGLSVGAAAGGGIHGLLRSLESEYPHLFTKVADFDHSLSDPAMAARVVDEVLAPGGGGEIGYRSGQRVIFGAEPASLAERPDSEAWRPRADWVVLATGGARGITAEICRDLARPGVRLVLVGRSAGGEGEAAAERDANLASFRLAGAEAEYHGLDVRDEAAFGGLIDGLYDRFGRIDAVLHGAGIIEDRRFAAKEADSFDRVFDTKADSGFILSRHLRGEGLKWVALFGSVAGRFGNQGQGDYAAGNETLARLGQVMATDWPDARVVTIHWGPWRGAGMAGEGVQALLEAQGIATIDLESGRQFFVDELSRGGKGDTEVVAGHGPWEAQTDRLLASVFEASVLLLRVRAGVEQAKDPR